MIAYSRMEAGRLPRHSPLRSRRRDRSRADDRPRDGRRSALHARRPLPAVVVRSHRHLRRLRVRARDGAALSGHQRADGRVPARRLQRRQPAGVHRLHQRRIRPVHDAVRSEVVPAGPAVRQRAARRPAQPATPTAIRPTPWWAPRGRRRSRAPPATSRGSTCTRGPGTSASTPTRWGWAASGFISTTIGDPVGNHNVFANLLVPLDRRPFGQHRLLVHAPLPVVRPELPADRAAGAGPDHRRRQHALPPTRASAARASTRADLPADAVLVGRAVVRLRLQRVRARRSRCPSRIRRAASS